MNPTTPDWLHNAVLDGLQSLIVLSLDGTPGRELFPGTLTAWAEAIARHRDLRLSDLARIRDAFAELRATCTRWPAPAQLCAVLDRPRPSGSGLAPDRRDPDSERAHAVRNGQLAAEGGWTDAEILAAGWIPPERVR